MLLDKTAVKILKYIRDNAPTELETVASLVHSETVAEKYVHSLKTHRFIRGLSSRMIQTPNGPVMHTFAPFEITPEGLACLEDIKKERLRFWIPVTVSILAFLVSLASLAIDGIQIIKNDFPVQDNPYNQSNQRHCQSNARNDDW